MWVFFAQLLVPRNWCQIGVGTQRCLPWKWRMSSWRALLWCQWCLSPKWKEMVLELKGKGAKNSGAIKDLTSWKKSHLETTPLFWKFRTETKRCWNKNKKWSNMVKPIYQQIPNQQINRFCNFCNNMSFFSLIHVTFLGGNNTENSKLNQQVTADKG